MPEVFSHRATFLLEYLDLPEAVGDPAARWEPFQIRHLNNEALLGIEKKARQVGWSWLTAAEAVADGILNPRSNNIFVSINQEEAGEKIRYAKQIIEALDRQVRPKLINDNRLEIEFQNGSRLISHPNRPVRGKPKARIYLDEFAHYPKDKEIYAAALPATTKGGYIRIGSSPLGAQGMFWEIYGQKIRPYPGFVRDYVPWWLVRALCLQVPTARTLAPAMLTEERVRAFGTQRIIEIFENMPLEDFQQEYECAWVDESVAWITWDEIKRNQSDEMICFSAQGKEQAFEAVDQLVREVERGKVEQVFAGGMDVGRTRNTSELFLVGKSTTAQLPLRLMVSLDNVEFEDQQAVIDKVVTALPITKLLIDRTGIGMQLAENSANKHGMRVEGVTFTNELKHLWSVEMKVQMQKGNILMPIERALSYQIHSIKKKVTAAKNVTYDTGTNEKHHADKYWALALAVWAAKTDSVGMGVWSGGSLTDYRG